MKIGDFVTLKYTYDYLEKQRQESIFLYPNANHATTRFRLGGFGDIENLTDYKSYEVLGILKEINNATYLVLLNDTQNLQSYNISNFILDIATTRKYKLTKLLI